MILTILKRFGVIKKFCHEGHLMEPSWNACPVCMAPICGWLVGLSGSHSVTNKVYTLHQGKIKIGTAYDCEVRILEDSISREQAMIVQSDKHYTLTDLGSVGGTFVNNKQISHKDIIDGDIIRFGEIEFLFKCI